MKKSLCLVTLLALSASSFISAKVAVYATLSDVQEEHWGIFQLSEEQSLFAHQEKSGLIFEARITDIESATVRVRVRILGPLSEKYNQSAGVSACIYNTLLEDSFEAKIGERNNFSVSFNHREIKISLTCIES